MATWKVEGVSAYPRLNDKDNVVYSVHWSIGAYDSITNLDLPSDDFIPFDQLTEETVLGWVWAKTPKAECEARAAKYEESLKNPPPEPVAVSLPWSK